MTTREKDGTELSQKLFDNRIWLNSEEAADYLRISVGSLRNKTSNGKIPYYKLDKLNRYLKDDLDELLLSKKKGENSWE